MGSNKTRKDSAEIMDAPGGGYIYCCLAMPWKSAVLSVRLMPALQQIWKGPEWEELAEFVDRWVSYGRWYPSPQCEGRYDHTGQYLLCDLDNEHQLGEDFSKEGYRVTDFQYNMWRQYGQ